MIIILKVDIFFFHEFLCFLLMRVELLDCVMKNKSLVIPPLFRAPSLDGLVSAFVAWVSVSYCQGADPSRYGDPRNGTIMRQD